MSDGLPVLPVPLRRLIRPAQAEALLAKFQALLPGLGLALADSRGERLASSGDPPDGGWPAEALRLALAAAVDERRFTLGEALVQPLAPGGALAGALLASRGGLPIDAAGRLLEALRFTLNGELQQALERRELNAEVLERYRELNLLYRATATLGACLDPGRIPAMVLEQVGSVVPADALALLLEAPGSTGADPAALGVAACQGPEGLCQALQAAAGPVIERALRTGEPLIFTPGPPQAAGIGVALCAPLQASERSLGVLLIGRRAPLPELTASNAKLVMALAGTAAIALETARLHQEELNLRSLEEELAIGRQIQESFLPGACPEIPGWEFAAAYQAARQVGGDLYDFFPSALDPDRLDIVIADVTGKGIAAALYMAFTRTLLRSTAAQPGGPAEILRRANRLIMQERRAGLFLSAVFASLDVLTGELAYASGGHEWPLLRGADGALQALDAPGRLLGVFPDVRLEERRVRLNPGDLLVLYTDGVTDARSADGRLYDEARLAAVIGAAAAEPGEALNASRLLQAMLDDVDAFRRGAEPADDLTLVVIKRQAIL